MNRTAPIYKISLLVFVAALLTGGILSIYFGKELQWDLAGYHYYNPFAFLHHRNHLDYWPGSNIQIYLNPSMDFFSYFLINNFSPLSAEFILGAIHGINIWLMFYLSYLFLKMNQNDYPIFLSILFAYVGMYGPISFSEIGSFMNDNFISLFVIFSVLLQIIFFQNRFAIHKNSYVLSSGFFLGLACGLKLTASLFAFGAIASFFLVSLHWKVKVKILTLWTLGFVCGFLLLSGYWMYFLWEHFHSPFFPLFNRLFHAPDFPIENWHDLRFMPKNIMQTLFYPFYFSWNGQASDLPLTDFRLPILYVLFILNGMVWIRKKLLRMRKESLYSSLNRDENNVGDVWLILFALFAYIAWQFYFSNLRYLVALQIMSPLLIYLLIRNIFTDIKYQIVTLSFIFIFITLKMTPMNQERLKPFGHDYFNVKIPSSLTQIKTATVLMAYSAYSASIIPFPQTYLIPFFPENWRFIGIPFHNMNEYELPPKVKELLQEQNGIIYLLSSQETMKAFYKAANELGFKKKGHCETIISDRHRNGVLICPFAKTLPFPSGLREKDIPE